MKYILRDPEDIEILKAQTNTVWNIVWLCWIKVFREYTEELNISSMLPKCDLQFIQAKVAAKAMVGLGIHGSACG